MFIRIFLFFVWFSLSGVVYADNPMLPSAERLVNAASGQVGKTTIYDPAYVGLSYPMGDISRKRGVCTDVIIRAFRDAFAVDLQKLVHEDMKRNFSAYPKIWGLKRTDRNIDHRRVPNLRAYFKRAGASLQVTDDPRDFKPGDLVSQTVGGNLPHIVIVSNQMSADGSRPLVIHNIGGGTQIEDSLFKFPITGHYRFKLNR